MLIPDAGMRQDLSCNTGFLLDHSLQGVESQLCAIPTIELVVAAQGGEPPEEATVGWCLKETKMTTDMWLVAQ